MGHFRESAFEGLRVHGVRLGVGEGMVGGGGGGVHGGPPQLHLELRTRDI